MKQHFWGFPKVLTLLHNGIIIGSLCSPYNVSKFCMVPAAGISLLAFGIKMNGIKNPADFITYFRILLMVGFLILFPFLPSVWYALYLAIAILMLDGLDGYVARKFDATNTGATLDMEADALYTMILCLILAHEHHVSPIILAIAWWRPIYVFYETYMVACLPSHRPVARYIWQSKAICAFSISTLIILMVQIAAQELRNILITLTIALISYSFMKDIIPPWFGNSREIKITK